MDCHQNGFDLILQNALKSVKLLKQCPPLLLLLVVFLKSLTWAITFLIYVNDLPNSLSFSSASLFADGTNLTTSGISAEVVQSRLNEDQEEVHRWLLADKLTLNIKKKPNRIYVDRL